ncbi:MAG: hypothetical protein HY556_06625 [Euryarchaeota archaeon]|nr:hypothetical protein [Euryarchaeota archaeon]
MAKSIAPLMLATVLISTSFAGCLENLPDDLPFFSSSEEASLKTLYGLAEREARAWRSAAVLISAAAYEFSPSAYAEMSSNADESEDDADSMRALIGPDPNIGNGKGVAWLVEFKDPETRDTLGIVIAAKNKTVIIREESKADEDDDSNVRALAWKLDSDDAARTAHGNKSFEEPAAKLSDPQYVVGLGSADMYGGEDDGEDKWVLWAWDASKDEDNGAGVIAVVNAETGDVVFAGPFPGFGNWGGSGWNSSWSEEWGNESGSWGNWSQGWGNWTGKWPAYGNSTTTYDKRHEGNLTLAAAEASHEFPVAESDRWGEIGICWGQKVPGAAIEVEVKDPDGSIVGTLNSDARGPSQSTLPLPLDGSSPGDYIITIRLAEGPGNIASDYRVRIVLRTSANYMPPEAANPFGSTQFTNC